MLRCFPEMDDPVFKSKYQKYKYKVKVWEKSFRQINGRIPSKVRRTAAMV